jgi:hypothetical protein
VTDCDEAKQELEMIEERLAHYTAKRQALKAQIIARILSEHGLHVSSPDEGDLDDVERERWNACVEIAKALS